MQKVRMMKRYADFLIEVGMHSVLRQDVVIYADVDMSVFVRYLVGELYKAKVRRVQVVYHDQDITRQWVNNTPETRIPAAVSNMAERVAGYARENMILVDLVGRDFHSLKRFSPNKLMATFQALSDSYQYFLAYATDRIKHVRAVVPTRDWAAEMYPDLTPSQALDHMWQQLFAALELAEVRNDEAVMSHFSQVDRAEAAMNQRNLYRLHLTVPSVGTDLTVQLPLKGFWRSAVRTDTTRQETFVSYIPSGGIYTSTHSHGTDGVLAVTAPLYLYGERIAGARLTFRNGEVVEATAETGAEALNAFIQDVSARRPGILTISAFPAGPRQRLAGLGCEELNMASPVALCLGQSSADSLAGSELMDRSERISHGLNQAYTRLSLPVYAPDLCIVGESIDALGNRSNRTVYQKGRLVLD